MRWIVVNCPRSQMHRNPTMDLEPDTSWSERAVPANRIF